MNLLNLLSVLCLVVINFSNSFAAIDENNFILSRMRNDKENVCIFPTIDIYEHPQLQKCMKMMPNFDMLQENNLDVLCMSFYDTSLRLCEVARNKTFLMNQLKEKIPQNEIQFNNLLKNNNRTLDAFCADAVNMNLIHRPKTFVKTAPYINTFISLLQKGCSQICSTVGQSLDPLCPLIVWGNQLYVEYSNKTETEASVTKYEETSIGDSNTNTKVNTELKAAPSTVENEAVSEQMPNNLSESTMAEDVASVSTQETSVNKNKEVIKQPVVNNQQGKHVSNDNVNGKGQNPPKASKSEKPVDETEHTKPMSEITIATIINDNGGEQKSEMDSKKPQNGANKEEINNELSKSKINNEVNNNNDVNKKVNNNNDVNKEVNNNDDVNKEVNNNDDVNKEVKNNNNDVNKEVNNNNDINKDLDGAPINDEENNVNMGEINGDGNIGAEPQEQYTEDDDDVQIPSNMKGESPVAAKNKKTFKEHVLGGLNNDVEAEVEGELIVRDRFIEAEDSHFFTYFVTMAVLSIIVYLVFHNKKKLVALAVEGRRTRGTTRRRPNTASYSKLDCNLEEAMVSNTTASVTHVLY